MRTGTNCFISQEKAIKYYGETPQNIKQKIANGEIVIGEPKKTHQRQSIIVDGQGRYWIQEMEPLIGVEVCLKNGHSWKTEMNATPEKATKYFQDWYNTELDRVDILY